VQAVRDQLGISERQACRYVCANRRMIRYARIPKDDGPLRARLEELAAEQRRFGFRRLAVLIRRDGWIVNIKRALRVSREASLQVRKRLKRRVALGRGMAYFPEEDVVQTALQKVEHASRHRDLGPTSWYSVQAGDKKAPRGAWQHVDLPAHASDLRGRIAFAWPAMDAFYEEDERIVGHAADPYHRLDVRQTSRHLVVRHHDRIIADTKRPLVLFESGFAPRWYVRRDDVEATALTAVDRETFCPYKGICSYYDIADARFAAWCYQEPYAEAARISNLLSFEPDVVSVELDGRRLQLEPGQTVIPHGPDRELTTAELDASRSE
jgi:uncharacterized protein (DUF427 family)